MQSEEKEVIVWNVSKHPPLDSLDGSRLSILKPIPNHPFLDVKSLYKHYENFCDIFDYLTDTMYLCKGLQLMTNDFTIENATIYIINPMPRSQLGCCDGPISYLLCGEGIPSGELKDNSVIYHLAA